MPPDRTSTDASSEARVLQFDASRRSASNRRACAHTRASGTPSEADRPIAAVVTVTRFIDGTKVHAQVAVYADEIAGHAEGMDHKLIPELSELLADGAVEANSYLDRVIATASARSLADFNAR